jgi:Tol biopolymer transport system component
VAGALGCGGGEQGVQGPFLAYAKSRTQSIWLARADGTHARPLVRGGSFPAVSPDGRWVAYMGCRDERELCLMLVPTSGGKPRLLLRQTGLPTWSPRSERMVTTHGEALVAVSLDGAVTVVVPRMQGEWAISPDGRRVAYTRPLTRTQCGSELVLVGLDGRGRRVIARGRDYGPVWGPNAIALSRYPRGCVLARRLWRVSPDGVEARPITAPPPRKWLRAGLYGYDAIAWTPDGRTLLGGIASEWGGEAVRVDVATGRIRRLRGYALGLSRDGRFALTREGASEGPQTILAVPLAGGRPHVLARGDVCCPSWNR